MKIPQPKIASFAMVDPAAPTLVTGLAAGPNGAIALRYQNISTSPNAVTNQFWQYSGGKWTHLKELDGLILTETLETVQTCGRHSPTGFLPMDS